MIGEFQNRALETTSLLLFLVLVVGLASPAHGQSRIEGFRWDWRNTENHGWTRLDQSTDLTPTERKAVLRALKANMRATDSPDEEIQNAAAQTDVKAISLDRKGAKQIAAQDRSIRSCSPTGNCDFWILRKSGERYSVILYRPNTQTMTIQPTAHDGFRDVVLGQHGSATDQELHLYQFGGTRYREAACYDAEWEVLENGKVRDLKEPRITPCAN